MDVGAVLFGGAVVLLLFVGFLGASVVAAKDADRTDQGGEEMPDPTPAEQIAELQRRLAALEAPQAASGFGGMIDSALQALGRPDSPLMSYARLSLAAGAAYVVQRGITDRSEADAIVGAVMGLLAVLWVALRQYITTRWLHVAIAAPQGTTLPELAALVPQVAPGPVTDAKVAAAVEKTATKGGTS